MWEEGELRGRCIEIASFPREQYSLPPKWLQASFIEWKGVLHAVCSRIKATGSYIHVDTIIRTPADTPDEQLSHVLLYLQLSTRVVTVRRLARVTHGVEVAYYQLWVYTSK